MPSLKSTAIRRSRLAARDGEAPLPAARDTAQERLLAIHSVIISVDLAGRVTHWNRLAESTFGVPADRALGASLFACGVRWEARVLRDGLDRCRITRRPLRLHDVRYRLKDGREGLVGFTASPLRDGGRALSGFLLVGAEVSERRRAEEEVRRYTRDLEAAKTRIEQEKAKDAAILASIGEAVIGTDSAGRITVMNEEAETVFGRKAAELVGKRIHEAIRLEDENGDEIPPAARPVAAVLAGSRKVSATAYCVLKDKSRLPCVITASPVMLGGRMIGTIMIARDVTKEREADKMKSEFISTVSHELRTPLTVIKEGVSIVLEGIAGPVEDEQRRFLSITLENIDRLKRIIDDVLDMSKIEAGKFKLRKEPVNLVELVQKVANTFYPQAAKAGLELKTRFERTNIWVRADRDKVFQVFANLVGNALKFTRRGRIEIAIAEREREVECAVTDTGRGIAQKDIRKVFEKFQQCGRVIGPGVQGTGLGLAIAKGFVELHEGRIWVRSKINKGSRFVFTLPRE
jgi:PAS domain S-box-containing protein